MRAEVIVEWWTWELTGRAIPHLTRVEPREGYRIWLRYDDGASGEVDLSHLAGQGVFAAWKDRAFFESVRVTDYGAVAWGEEIDLCPDKLYMDLTGKKVEDLMPGFRAAGSECLNSHDSTESLSACTSTTTARPIFTRSTRAPAPRLT